MSGRFSTTEVLESKVLPGVIEAYPDSMAVQTQNDDEVIEDFTIMIDDYEGSGFFYGREVARGVYNNMDFQVDYF